MAQLPCSSLRPCGPWGRRCSKHKSLVLPLSGARLPRGQIFPSVQPVQVREKTWSPGFSQPQRPRCPVRAGNCAGSLVHRLVETLRSPKALLPHILDEKTDQKAEARRAGPRLISRGTGISLRPTSEPRPWTLSILSPRMMTHESEGLTRGKLERMFQKKKKTTR